MKLLFVDDDASVLHGLERLLSILEGDWESSFANGASEALELLKEHPFDVVVSDMRMPQIDGATLLAKIQSQYPGIVRIVLSGHADQATSMGIVKSAHQFLAKPCAPETLLATLQRAEVLSRLVSSSQVRELVAKLPNIPSVPALYASLVRELNRPDVAIDKVCEVLASDVAMSAKMLQLVNSAFFGLPKEVSDVRTAAAFLGLDLLGALVLSAEAFSMFPLSGIETGHAELLQIHSLSVSVAARKIAESFDLSKTEVGAAAVTGMLHDIGELIIGVAAPKSARQIADRVTKGESVWDAERNVLGTTHAAIGAYLLGIWGLPVNVVEGVCDQVDPVLNPDGSSSLSLIVNLANAYVHESRSTKPNLESYFTLVSPALMRSENGEQFVEQVWDQIAEKTAA